MIHAFSYEQRMEGKHWIPITCEGENKEMIEATRKSKMKDPDARKISSIWSSRFSKYPKHETL